MRLPHGTSAAIRARNPPPIPPVARPLCLRRTFASLKYGVYPPYPYTPNPSHSDKARRYRHRMHIFSLTACLWPDSVCLGSSASPRFRHLPGERDGSPDRATGGPAAGCTALPDASARVHEKPPAPHADLSFREEAPRPTIPHPEPRAPTGTDFQSCLCSEWDRSAAPRIDDPPRASASRFLSRRQGLEQRTAPHGASFEMTDPARVHTESASSG
jgi:hypothetical protein